MTGTVTIANDWKGEPNEKIMSCMGFLAIETDIVNPTLYHWFISSQLSNTKQITNTCNLRGEIGFIVLQHRGTVQYKRRVR